MSWFHEFRFRFGAMLRRRRLETEMAEEIRQHIELRTERIRATGMSPDDSRNAALRDFGGYCLSHSLQLHFPSCQAHGVRIGLLYAKALKQG
jgi:hypothetical protein